MAQPQKGHLRLWSLTFLAKEFDLTMEQLFLSFSCNFIQTAAVSLFFRK